MSPPVRGKPHEGAEKENEMSTIETAEATPQRKRRFRFRKMTWVLIDWCLIVAVWFSVGANGASQSHADCINDPNLSQEACEAAVGIGSTIGGTLVLGDRVPRLCFLSLIWFMSRPRQVVYVTS